MNKVFIGSLSWNVREAELEKVFGKIGELEDVKVITDRETGRSRGFAFITYKEPDDAQKAVDELDGIEIDGRQVAVKIAHEKRQDRSFGGGNNNRSGGRSNGGGYNRW